MLLDSENENRQPAPEQAAPPQRQPGSPEQPMPEEQLTPEQQLELREQPAAAPQPASEELRVPPGRRLQDPPWSAGDVLLIGFFFFIVDVGAMFVAVGAAVRFGHLTLEQAAFNAWLLVPVQVFAYIAGLLFMYWLVTRSYARPFWRTVRWVWPGTRRKAIALLVAGVPLAFVTTYLESVLPMPKELPIQKFFRTPTSAWLMAGLAIAAAPFIEELFFRGFLYPVARRAGAVAGVVITSLAFAIVHGTQYGWSATAVVLLFGVGLVLTITRARSGSVAPGFLIHVGYNLTLFVLLYIASDQFRHLERVS